MNRLIELLRSLGNEGAVANARLVLDEHRRDEWLVRSLVRRLEQHAPEPAHHAA